MLRKILKERFENLDKSASKGSMRAAVDEIHAILLHIVDGLDDVKREKKGKQILLETSDPEVSLITNDPVPETTASEKSDVTETVSDHTEADVPNVDNSSTNEETSEVHSDEETKKPKKNTKKPV